MSRFSRRPPNRKSDGSVSELLYSQGGKVLYAVAYRNPNPRIRYLLAKNYADAIIQVLKTRHTFGEVDSIAPAVGSFGQHEERKRIYLFGG